MLRPITLVLSLIFLTPISYAEKATGVIEELRVCGTGLKGADTWIRTLVFKVDNKWFGTYADHFSYNWSDIDNNITTSLIMMSYAQKLIIEINATEQWAAEFSRCGIPNGHVFHANAGDYVKLK